MFNRFTSQANQVLFYARSEVSQLGSPAIGPEHILLEWTRRASFPDIRSTRR